MNIEIHRTDRNEIRTIGSMYIDNKWTCYTLEDPIQKEKVPGNTAIPAGSYDITITYSPHFNRDLPLVNNVSNFDGIRIHAGNTPADTRGCILVGLNRITDRVIDSKIALDNVQNKIQQAINRGEKVTLYICSIGI